MIHTTEPSLDPIKLADNTIVTRLQSFNDEIKSTGVVSREDILSLEEFIGVGIITTNHPINGFSNTKSSIGLDVVRDVVDCELRAATTGGDITYNDVFIVVSEVYGKLDHLLKHLTYFKNIPSDVMGRFLNEKYIYSYVNEHGNETNELVDISKTLPIMSVFTYRNDYLSSITSMIDTSNRVFDNIKHITLYLQAKHSKEIQMDYTPLLSAIKGKLLWKLFHNEAYTVDIVTVRDMVEMYADIQDVIEHFNGFTQMVRNDYQDMVNNYSAWMFGNNQDLKRTYGKYRNIASVVNDELSETILDIFKQFKKED